MAKFYGIGVGPGDKELLTLKAVKVLSMLDALILPTAKKDTLSIAFEIAKDYIKSDIELISVEFPMVQDFDRIMLAGKKAAEEVEKAVKLGKNIGFITLGDPSIYSTYSYILRALDNAVEVETIPGITSFCAAAALVNKPLVEREEILSVVPATASLENVEAAIENSGGLAFLKVYNHGEKIISLLEKHKLSDSSVLIKRCGMKDCSIETDIKSALEKEKQYLSIILSKKENS